MKLKPLIHIALISAFAFMSTLAPGAEESAEESTEEEETALVEASPEETSSSAEEGPTAEDLSSSEESASSSIEDTFIPSQQISEDLSVSFPVNI